MSFYRQFQSARPTSSRKFIHIAKPVSAILVTAGLLLGCSLQPPKPEEPAQTQEQEPKVEITPVKPPPVLVAVDPEIERQNALQEQDWAKYLQLSDEIWQESPPAYQQEIESQVWQNLLPLDELSLQNLDDNADPRVNAWSHLVEVFRLKDLAFKQGLNNLKIFDDDAIYQSHLLPQLLSGISQETPIRNIAIFLPTNGRYKVVSEQIQAGLLKAYFQNTDLHSKLQLRFYDSSDLTQVSSLYFRAKQDGADVIIGPLQKDAVEQLQGFDDDRIVALNSIIARTSFPQFSLKSNDKIQQLIEGFWQQRYQMIGILNSDNKQEVLDSSLFISAWNQPPEQSLVQVTYSNIKPKLGNAFAKLVNASNSSERKNVLSWAIGEKLGFYPRVRQDLDSILVFDSANRLAVINPQKALYLMDIPVYSATELNQQNLQTLQNNPDLNGVELLTQPLTLNPSNIEGRFEAFGWDALQIAANLPSLQEGACLSNTKTGQLKLVGNRIQQSLIWAKFNRRGELQPFQLPVVLPEPEEVPIEVNGDSLTPEQELQQRIRLELQAETATP